MTKTFSQLSLVLFIATCIGCHAREEKKVVQFEAISSAMVIDSLSAHWPVYHDGFTRWKQIYEQCMQSRIFPNAFYLGLQENMGIGTISNSVMQDVNRNISVLDTSHNKKIFDLLAINTTANCNTKIEMSKDLQNAFFNELTKNLKQTTEYKYVANLVDTNGIVFKITTLFDVSILPDSLVSLLQRTNDSSLLRYRQMLLTANNAVLVRAATIFGFYAEFSLSGKLSPEQANKFQKEVPFTFGSRGENGSIRLLANQHLLVFINKPYTVLGQFYSFKELE